MNPGLAVVIAVAALVAGYVLGRARPAQRLHAWNWDRTIHGAAPSRGDQVLFVALNPSKTLRAWKRRNEPERGRAPAPQIGERWRKLHDASSVSAGDSTPHHDEPKHDDLIEEDR